MRGGGLGFDPLRWPERQGQPPEKLQKKLHLPRIYPNPILTPGEEICIDHTAEEPEKVLNWTKHGSKSHIWFCF